MFDGKDSKAEPPSHPSPFWAGDDSVPRRLSDGKHREHNYRQRKTVGGEGKWGGRGFDKWMVGGRGRCLFNQWWIELHG